jgi:dolichol-phosphate mannosyltransferase
VTDAGQGWPSLGVVVPVYNEAASIDAGGRAIAAAAQRYPGRCVVIAVEDGSADDSLAILERLATELADFELVPHEGNRGYGQALRTGAQHARALELEYVAFIDSDLTNPPEDLMKIGALAAEGADYIKASRFIPGGGMAAVPLARRVVSRSGNVVARRLFGTSVHDVTNGFRAGRTELVSSWPTTERTFAVIVEEFDFALRDGVTPVEFPSTLTARTDAQRGSAFSYTAALILSYLRYPLRSRLRRLRRPKRR